MLIKNLQYQLENKKSKNLDENLLKINKELEEKIIHLENELSNNIIKLDNEKNLTSSFNTKQHSKQEFTEKIN